MENVLSELLCGLQKAHSTQHALCSVGYVGTIFMDLSKARDSLSHDLLIAKLVAYGLGIGSLNMLLG